ncbi:ESX secretion-associated protein EspG [Rhodococcoides yunnanense]|uniref:ESX secretion-associated protein EspG n=1 Tax=Rhodococcoides yunnanense TaxID=278209 RepID=A0ABU4B9I0_9NOCA|nr:ESX secretion-associated protein EspG [Rhodococcus yunnanensis]MDV6260848.1 ESX secretion-associated protein EspG [Rhodococcus yunnanensis]
MIDLGTVPVGHTLPNAALGVDEMDFLVDELSITELPVVLDVFPRFDDVAARDRALGRGRAALDNVGLITGGRVHEDLQQWMRVLEQPHWYVSARVFDVENDEPAPTTRICVASDDRITVSAVRRENVLTIRVIHGDPARDLAATIGSATPFDPGHINAPTALLAEALDAAPSDVGSTASRLGRIGMADDRASALAAAMATCAGRTEITAVAPRHGTRHVAGRPVALFDTRAGRIVATSTLAADGTCWSSMTGATDRKVTAALTELIESAREHRV